MLTNFVAPAWIQGTPLGDLYVDVWTETGDAIYALEVIRQDPSYDTYFPGNRREDGSTRYDENTYLGMVDSYTQSLRDVGMSDEAIDRFFRDQFTGLIEGEVSPLEFDDRVSNVYQRVSLAGDDIQTWYTENYGLEMTNESIIASILDPNLGEEILNRRITMAEIGGTAAFRGFDLAGEFVTMLAEQGMDLGEAQRNFGSAQQVLPLLAAAARRQGDTSDWDIESFIETSFLDDPEGLAAIRRISAGEESTFTGGAQTELQRSRRLGLTGLAAN